MNKDKFFTVRWNNLMTLGLSIPALTYVAIVFFSSMLSDKVGFLGMVGTGILYCLIIETHSGKLLEWQMKKSGKKIPTHTTLPGKAVLIIYNLIWWVPIVFPFVDLMDYRTGSFIFFFTTLSRAFINLYRLNVLTIEKAIHFPLRSA